MKSIGWPIFALATVIVFLDQATKFWALKTLVLGEPVVVIQKVLHWVLAKNSGAAFSFLSNATWIFTTISFSVAVFITVYVLLKKVHMLRWAIVSSLILAGAVGNLIDRLFREPGFAVGHVIDFIYTPWIVPAVYNVADISIVIGMGLFMIFSIFTKQEETND